MTPEPIAGRSFLTTIGLVFVAIAALFAADMFLAGMERAETGVEAARLFQQGRALMERGKNAEAINRIADAILIERGNRTYRRTLAQAQLAAGMTTNAEATLAELLQSDSSDGFASLLMGRALEKGGRFAEAISYLHRAIYGQWDKDAAENRLRVRYELIDLLAKRNSKEELLAELLPIGPAVSCGWFSYPGSRCVSRGATRCADECRCVCRPGRSRLHTWKLSRGAARFPGGTAVGAR